MSVRSIDLVKRLAGISFPVRCYFHSVIMTEGPSPKKCKLEVSSDEDTPQDTLLSNNNCPETITDRDNATFKVCFILYTTITCSRRLDIVGCVAISTGLWYYNYFRVDMPLHHYLFSRLHNLHLITY